MSNRSRIKAGLVLTGLLCLVGLSIADRSDWKIDSRYGHNRAYPPAGFSLRRLPESAVVVRHSGMSYYFNDGIWYRHHGVNFSVVVPPIGLVVPVLPPFFSTVWFGGVPYYYANDTYYVSTATHDGYVVSTPPNGQTPKVLEQTDTLFVYPKNGQSKEQQATDRYECYRWAADQTGFDITQPLGGVNAAVVESREAAYQRAERACLEARGYSVQ